MTPLGLGLAALGRPGYLNLGHGRDLGATKSVAALEARTHEVLDAAWARGIRYFDVARSYGCGEDFLESWLRRRRLEPRAVTIGSKWGYVYTADWRVDGDPPEIKDLRVTNLRHQLAQTRARLGSHLCLYQIHSATLQSGVLDDHAVLDELAALRARGVAIGLTVSGPDQAQTIERALEVGGFDAVQATWNLHERSAETALARAHRAGLGVIVKEALANGRLSDRGAPADLRALARERESTCDAVALAAALARPWADVVLSGAATVATLRSNLHALELDWEPGDDERLAALREDPDAYWAARGRLAWT